MEVQIVLLAQDPYPTPGDADGLCFSTRAKKRPMSLRVIFKTIASEVGDLDDAAEEDDWRCNRLENWAAQGMLMLNSFLTTEKGVKRAHPFWEALTNAIVRTVAEVGHDVDYLLWGNDAQKKEKFLRGVPAYKIHKHTHPADSAYGKPFDGCGHFAAMVESRGWDWRARLPVIRIFTDGSCKGINKRGGVDREGKSGKAGAGMAIVEGLGATPEEPKLVSIQVPDPPTNNRAEGIALVEALELLSRTVWSRAEVFTDSKYAFNQSMDLWKPNTNFSLVKRLRKAYKAVIAQGKSISGEFTMFQMRGHGKADKCYYHACSERPTKGNLRDIPCTQEMRDGNDLADEAARNAADIYNP